MNIINDLLNRMTDIIIKNPEDNIVINRKDLELLVCLVLMITLTKSFEEEDSKEPSPEHK